MKASVKGSVQGSVKGNVKGSVKESQEIDEQGSVVSMKESQEIDEQTAYIACACFLIRLCHSHSHTCAHTNTLLQAEGMTEALGGDWLRKNIEFEGLTPPVGSTPVATAAATPEPHAAGDVAAVHDAMYVCSCGDVCTCLWKFGSSIHGIPLVHSCCFFPVVVSPCTACLHAFTSTIHTHPHYPLPHPLGVSLPHPLGAPPRHTAALQQELEAERAARESLARELKSFKAMYDRQRDLHNEQEVKLKAQV